MPKRSTTEPARRPAPLRTRRRALTHLTAAAAAAALAASGARRAAAQAVWNGGTGDWNTPSNWSTGLVPNTDTLNVSIDGGNTATSSYVNISTPITCGSLAIDVGDVLSCNLNSLTLNGGATVNGIMSIGTVGATAFTLNFAGTNALTLGGSGQVLFGDPPLYQLNNNTGANVLTFAAGLTIHGRSAAFGGDGLGGFLNLATVSADVAGGNFDFSRPLTNGAGGTLQALNGGTLQFDTQAGSSGQGATMLAGTGSLLRFNSGTFTLTEGAMITGAGTASFSGAYLVIAGAATVSTALSMSAGSISGSGAISINGPFSWTGGLFGPGAGTATISSTGATISGPIARLFNYHLVIAPTATVTWNGPGNFYLISAAILENAGTFNILTDGSIQQEGFVGSAFMNRTGGMINKSSATNGLTLIAVPFTNNGAVNIISGALDVNQGGSAPTGTFSIAAGARLEFDGGTFTLGSGPISGEGIVVALGAAIAVPGSSVISAPLRFSNGSIGGSGSLSINGPLTWIAGPFVGSGGGGTATASNGITMSGGGEKALTNYHLINGPTSTATWGGVGAIHLVNAAVFENRGTFDATNDAAMVYDSGKAPFFLNRGTFNKSSTANASTVIGIAFTNSGTVNITSGTLNLSAGGADTGGVYNTSVGGNLLFASNHSLDGASAIAGPGTTTVGTTNGAIANLSGSLKNFNQGTLIVNTNGSLALASNGARVTSHVDSLTINGSGTFDLGTNEMLTLSAPALIKAYLANAYGPPNFRDWSKPGLTSRLARSDPTTYSVGYANGADQSAQDAGVTLQSGAPLAANQTVVRATLTGDANLDGTVNFFDITQLLGYKYNTGQPASYTDGDLNYDGVVDFFDIATLLSANYNTGETFPMAAAAYGTAPAALAIQPVPEPSSFSLMLLASASPLFSRHGRRQRGRAGGRGV
jgi:hypothetical protein